MPSSPQPAALLPTIPALDGIRGLGVGAILLFHAGHLGGGWLGVDLFFVLSGFLITSLLISEFERRGDISLRAFWVRRARRLLPALFAAVIGVCLYAALFVEPEDLERVRNDMIATLLYVANWRSIFAGFDYWNLFDTASPLDHTWSLAIEEQFYLVWPPLVLLILRSTRNSLGALLGCAVGLTILSASWMAYLYDPDVGTARVYFGTDTRISAPLIGAAMAAALRKRVRDWPASSTSGSDYLALAAAVFLAWSWVSWNGDDPTVYRGGLLAHGLASAALIATSILAPAGLAVRILSWSPLRWLGQVSYGAYLWHWPLYLAMSPERLGIEGWPLTILRIVVTLLVSAASYEYLEHPIRSGAWSTQRLKIASSVALVALAVGIAATDARWSPTAGETRREATDPDLVHGAQGGADILVIGDSLTMLMGTALENEAARRELRLTAIGGVGCTPLRPVRMRGGRGREFDLPHCAAIYQRWTESAERLRPKLVVFLQAFTGLASKKIDERWLHPCLREYDEKFESSLEELVRRFEKTGSASVLVTSVIPLVPESALQARREILAADDVTSTFVERTDCLNRVRHEVAKRTGARVLELKNFVCPGGVCRESIEGTTLRPDGVHFKGAGANLAARWILDELSPPR